MKNILTSTLVLILYSCATNTTEQTSQALELEINAPLLAEFKTQDPAISEAIHKIIKLLKTKNAPLDSLYLMWYQTDSIPWEFDIGHYQNFLSKALFKQDQARVDSILKYDSVEFVEWNIPPTGNLSGHDRFILYNPETGELHDFLHQ